MTRRQQRPSHSLTPHPQGPPVVPWGAVPSSPGGQCVPWGWPSGDRTHTPQTPPLSGLSPLRPSLECVSTGGAGGGKACSSFQSPSRGRLRLRWGHSRQHLPSSSPLLSGTLPLHRPAHPGPFSFQSRPLAPSPRGIPPTQHPQPEAPSVHLPSPRAGKARPVSLQKLASGGPARMENDGGLDPELGLKAAYSWFQ